MIKVELKDLESITKFLDKVSKTTDKNFKGIWENAFKATRLSKMIKDKYTQIKPDYE